MQVAGDAFGYALRNALVVAARGLIGTMVLMAPFFVLAYLAVWVARKASVLLAAIVFVPPVAVLEWYYHWGYVAAEHALLQKKWTAAALSIGLLPFFVGVPAVAAAVVLGVFLVRFWGRDRVGRS